MLVFRLTKTHDKSKSTKLYPLGRESFTSIGTHFLLGLGLLGQGRESLRQDNTFVIFSETWW